MYLRIPCRLRVRLDGIVGTGIRDAGGLAADLCRRVLHATVQRRLEMGGWYDQGSAGECENGRLVAAAGATRPHEAAGVRFPRRTVIPSRSGLSRRADSGIAGILRSRRERGAGW